MPLQFSVVRFQPDMQRHEVANVGILLFGPDGPQIRIAANLTKLLALDPNLSLQEVHNSAADLVRFLGHLWRGGAEPAQMCAAAGSGLAGLLLTPPGVISADAHDLESVLDDLEHRLVSAPAKRRAIKESTNRLNTELKTLFRQDGILGRAPDDISNHLVVPNFPIDPDTGLFAEFALRNGRLHVTETVDFRVGSNSEKKREAQAKTLLLVQALEKVGRQDLQRYVVVSGVTDAWAQPSVTLLSRHSDLLVVRESADDWSSYLDRIKKAAARPQAPSVFA
ncbi:DUF3037 domain-containing protein [Leptothrix discophora]|uniref:DUF3037 domain-containing protein n=1 Tax=Leptothrix discophora TaxID=89 RepID=A0ABT9G1K5_LEPDI|nr:DUF3037 domain-containing protein [Leptothrix discophora]MDP4300367.1 DUF3037 domain-containing protein [Leptothrix discophora]